jgi:methane monooxygenase PmoA-like
MFNSRRTQSIRFLLIAMATLVATSRCVVVTAETNAKVALVQGDGRIAVVIDGMPIAMYCYKDKATLRPYFAHVRTLDGIQVTRHHPPVQGHDLTDHDTLHPGIWLAFGDINGLDFWRNKAQIKHAKFIEPPKVGSSGGSFTVRNDYVDPNDPSHVVCNETTRYSIVPDDGGYIILWDIRFKSDAPFTFGDQEEMGLGIRMATSLRVGDTGPEKAPFGNGTIINSAGAVNEKAMWGDAADWCDFSGTIAGRKVGATICCHPENLRKSRFHARDYGMLTANPFAQGSFGKGGKLQTTVRPGDELRLRYGIFIHSDATSTASNSAAVYQRYLQLAK